MTEYEAWKQQRLVEWYDSLNKIDWLLKTTRKKKDQRILRGMKRDLKFAVSWLESGVEPHVDDNKEILVADFDEPENKERNGFYDEWFDYLNRFYEE